MLSVMWKHYHPDLRCFAFSHLSDLQVHIAMTGSYIKPHTVIGGWVVGLREETYCAKCSMYDILFTTLSLS